MLLKREVVLEKGAREVGSNDRGAVIRERGCFEKGDREVGFIERGAVIRERGCIRERGQ